MKASELIKELQDFATHGDLNVSISLATDGWIIISDKICIAVEDYWNGNEIIIRDFPY